MGASLSGSCYNYCSSLEQPVSRWQIQQTRRRRERGGKITKLICPFWRVKHQKIKYHRKAPRRFPNELCFPVFSFLFTILSPLYLQMTSLARITRQICTATLNSLSVGHSRTVHLDSFFYSFSILGPTSCPVEEKNLAWRWNDCLTLHENIWYHFMHRPMSESRRF